MTTGPGRPVEAMWNASWTIPGSSAGLLTRYECFTIGSVMPVMSASWKASVPIRSLRTCQVMATSGDESRYAVAMPVTRLVAPGPLVAVQTPTLPVARA